MSEVPGFNSYNQTDQSKPAVEEPVEEAPKRKPEKSDPRLMMALELMTKLQVGEVHIDGLEHLEEVPQDKKIVIATTHTTILDVPLAARALGNNLDLGIADLSLHHHLEDDAFTYIGLHAAGIENFHSVDYGKTKEGHAVPATFNPDNFGPMLEAMDGGKRIVISVTSFSEDDKLKRPGYGAVYLAELADAAILPVAVRVDSKDENTLGTITKVFKKKPDAYIHIGSPIELGKVEEIEHLKAIIDKRKSREKLSHEEVLEFGQLVDALREKREIVIGKINELLDEDGSKD
jgi:hypothetical protein